LAWLPSALSSSRPRRADWLIKRLTAPVLALLLVGLLHAGGLLAGLGNDGLDLLFRLRGPRPPDQRIVIVGVDEQSLAELGAWPLPRRFHGALLDRLRLARAVGFDFLFPESTADDELFSRALSQGPPTILTLARERDGRIARPAASLIGYAGLGHIETQLGGDGIVRRVDLGNLAAAADANAADAPPFALALLRAAHLDVSGRDEDAKADRRIINFYGPEESFLFLSYATVLTGRYPPEFFQDRLVLVGARAVGLGDAHITSFTRELPTPGVEIQATILSNLTAQSFIRPLPLAPWLAIGLLCLIAAAAWPNCGERINLLVNLGLAAVVLTCAALLFRRNLLFDFPLVLLFLVVAYPLHLVLQLLRAANRILLEARRLDQELDAGLQRAAGTIPATCLRPAHRANPLTASAIQRHLDRLQTAAQALSLQHHFLENLLKEELPPLILWEEPSGQAVFANTAFARFWAEHREDGQPHLPSRGRFLAAAAKPADGSASQAEPKGMLDVQSLGPRGRRFYQAELHPLPAPETGFHGILAVLQDVTDIKELERIKDEVVAIVSHELKLPLTAILGYGEILADALSDAPQQYAREICAQSRRLQRMIEDFLDIARLESGRTQVRRFPFPLGRMIEDAVAAVTPAAGKKSIALIVKQPSRTTPLLGDESLLLQAVINLLDNAVKFSPEHTMVTIELEEQANRFVLRVADQGPGIPAPERLQIFAKFQRGSRTAQAEGFGLGLHLAEQIVERHHGEIAALDADHGAVFQLILPKEDRDAEGALLCA